MASVSSLGGIFSRSISLGSSLPFDLQKRASVSQHSSEKTSPQPSLKSGRLR